MPALVPLPCNVPTAERFYDLTKILFCLAFIAMARSGNPEQLRDLVPGRGVYSKGLDSCCLEDSAQQDQTDRRMTGHRPPPADRACQTLGGEAGGYNLVG